MSYKLTLFLQFGSKLEQVYQTIEELQVDHLYYMNTIDNVIGYQIDEIKGEN